MHGGNRSSLMAESKMKNEKLSNLKIFLLIEVIALFIAMIMPITPSKTGSDTSLADWFFKDPNYFQEFLFHLIFTNIIIAFVAIGYFIWSRTQNRKSPS